MKKNASEILVPVVKALATAWKSYKRSVRVRNEDPMNSFWNDLFGVEVNDVDAAQQLALDVAKIRDNLKTKKIDKKFNDIIDNSF